jgi:Spy/CpxP family protein refolding chaperone
MNTRLTNTILIVMLILNVGFIGAWWMTHTKGHRMHHEVGPQDMKDKGMMFLTKRLGLDDNQKTQAEKIFVAHSTQMKKCQMEIGRFQKEILKSVAEDKPDSIRAFQYADSIGACRLLMQKEFYRSTMAIRQICNPEQKKKCDELMEDMMKRMNFMRNGHSDAMNRDSL